MKRISGVALAVSVAVVLVWYAGPGTPGDPDPGSPSGSGTSPAESYKQRVLREAMRGLRYDTGRVRIDETDRREVDRPGDPTAAREDAERGEMFLRRNVEVFAIGAFTEAVITTPDDPALYEGLGRALRRKGKIDEAEAALRTAIDRDPGFALARRDLAELLDANGRRNEAIEEWNRVLAIDPADGRAHARLAAVHLLRGDLDAARTHGETAERLGTRMAARFFPAIDALATGGSLPAIPVAAGGAPEVGPQVRVDESGIDAANETSIAASLTNPDEVVATWNDWRDSGLNEVVRMGVSVSLDGGATWNDRLVRPPLPNRSDVEGDPMTAYDPRTGDLWVGAISFASNGGLYSARKIAGSTSFEPSVQIGQLFFADKGWMAAGPRPGDPLSTNVYIAYNEGVRRSLDGGQTWSQAVDIGSGLGFLPRVGPDGTLHVSSWDGSDRHVLRKSTNGGVTFGPSITIATRLDVWDTQDGSRFPGNFRVPSINTLAVDPNSGVLYAVYPDTTNIVGGNANVDLYFTRSDDDGQTWSAPVALAIDGLLGVGDQFFPWLEVDGDGTLHLVYYDSQNTEQDDNQQDGFLDAYYAQSTDGGGNFTIFRLTEEPFNSRDDGLDRGLSQFMGDYLGLAYSGSKVYPCYPSSQNGDTDIFVHSIDVAGDPDALALEPPTPGIPRENSTITASGGTPGEKTFFVFGSEAGTKNVAACPGFTIDIRRPRFLGKRDTNENGVATLEFFVPPRAEGRTILFQAGQVNPCAKSEVVSFTFGTP